MTDIDEKLFGMGLLHSAKPDVSGVLRQKFILPPFSVLDARAGEWQERKRAWLSLGIRSEIGRGENAIGLSDETRSEGLNYYRNGGGTLGAIPPNERTIMKRTGKYETR